MARDSRDALWEVSFETFYDTYYNEIVADRLISAWQAIDDTTRVIVAITASGSAVAGWSLWSQPALRMVWLIIAAISAVLAIMHTSLNVPNRVKLWTESRVSTASLRIDLDTMRQNMRVERLFPIKEFQSTYSSLRKRFGEVLSGIPNDLLLTKRLRNMAQDELNQRIKDAIMPTKA
jgi:hypothetical protein